MGFWNKSKDIEQLSVWSQEEEETPEQPVVEEIGEIQSQPIIEAKSVNRPPAKKAEVGPRKITSRIERTNRLNVNDRMDLMVSFYMAVINGVIKSLIVQGGPGLGKTYMLKRMFEEIRNGGGKRLPHHQSRCICIWLLHYHLQMG